ncbi:MAG: N-acetylglucosamine-6-phosphate deacetylase [Isosphaeraceae bacterium]
MRLIARHYLDGYPIAIELADGRIVSVSPAEGLLEVDPPGLWVAPAFWDIQLNGRWGYSFSSPGLTVEQVAEIVRAQGALGTARLCPTLITAPVRDMLHGLRTIAAACDRFPDVAARVLGIHLEGPFLSALAGYRGAHPAEAMRDPDWSLFQEFQAAAGGRIVLITLAPERDGAIEFIARAAREGIAIALGHTAAGGEVIRRAARAGARLSTHLGNGIESTLPRHPNPIWDQAACDQLAASFIADGHHLDTSTLRVLARAKSPARTILITDASPLAGLPPGCHGEWAVEPSGKIVVSGTPYLAGSNVTLSESLTRLLETTAWSLPEAIATVTTNPARVLCRPAPRIEPGEPANLALFRFARHDHFELARVCVDGRWSDSAGESVASE